MKQNINPKKGTTIAINIATSEALDEYCKAKKILKKDFVSLALEWFKEMDIDITSETKFKPEQDIQNLPSIQSQFGQLTEVMKLIPKYVEMAKVQGSMESENKYLKEENQELKEKYKIVLSELKRIEREQRTIGKIKINIPG